MSRLSSIAERIAVQSVFYHVTPVRKVSQIKKSGIKAPAYLWDRLKVAIWFKRLHEDKSYADDAEPMTILYVNTSGLKMIRDRETEDMSEWDIQFSKGMFGGGWIVREGIEPERIL